MGGQNRIVVDYGDYEGLVLLGAFDTKSGVEICRTELEKLEGFEVVTTYKTWGENWNELKKEISNSKEGYVIRFRNGFRMKIKGEEYVRLHRILTGFSNVDIWEYLKDGKNIDELLDRVPDEFDKWVKTTIKDLRYGAFQLRETAGKLHDGFRYGKFGDRDPEPNKKEYAEFVMTQQEVLHAIMFAMWDGNNDKVDDIIWKLIKPKYSKSFWQKEIE